MKNKYKVLIGLFIIGFFIPENFTMPVKNASKKDYNQESFWYYPWGKSGTHKGVDIFAKQGEILNSATNGVVLYTGELSYGGNVVLVLGPKWRLHYYAHLNRIDTHIGEVVSSGKTIGLVGDSGNAKGKQPHLHYSILTCVPYVWNIDSEPQGWKKMFYIDPVQLLNEVEF